MEKQFNGHTATVRPSHVFKSEDLRKSSCLKAGTVLEYCPNSIFNDGEIVFIRAFDVYGRQFCLPIFALEFSPKQRVEIMNLHKKIKEGDFEPQHACVAVGIEE